jgi:plasmid stability protein
VASILIRKLDKFTIVRLCACAAQHGRSVEEEAHEILKAGLTKEKGGQRNLVDSILRRFAAIGGVELPNVRREAVQRPPNFAG